MLKSFASLCALALVASATASFADPLGANQTLSPAPAGAVGTQTLLATTGYRTLNAATFSVGYAESVLTDASNPYGGLEFVYAFNNISGNEADFIENVTMSNYDGFLVNAFYQTKTDNGVTDVAPSSITRTSNTAGTLSNIRFSFDGGLQSGQDSDFLVLQTNANSYTTGTFTFQDGSTVEDLNVFAPSQTSVTPEPSSLVLLGTGLLSAAGAARRRFSL